MKLRNYVQNINTKIFYMHCVLLFIALCNYSTRQVDLSINITRFQKEQEIQHNDSELEILRFKTLKNVCHLLRNKSTNNEKEGGFSFVNSTQELILLH